MLTALDFLTLAFIVLSALSLLAVCLMFLVRKPVARKVCFYIVVILSIYMACRPLHQLRLLPWTDYRRRNRWPHRHCHSGVGTAEQQ